jgi:hypothetical protein
MQPLLGEKPDWDALINPQTEEQEERVRILKEVFKLDPAFMKQVDDHYGPLEWRLPDAHAIYWAMKGLDEVKRRYQNDPEGYETVYEKEFITLRRVIYQSMQMAFRRGRLIRVAFTEDLSRFDFGPNLDMVENANRAYEEMMAADEEWRDHIATGHRNMIEDATWFLFTYNRMEEARYWFNYLKEEYPESLGPNIDNVTLEDFAIAKLSVIANETDRDRVKLILEGYIESAYINLANGDENKFIGLDRLARIIYNNFQEGISKISDPESRIRVALPPYDLIREDVLKQLLASDSQSITPYVQNLLRTALGLSAGETFDQPEASPGEEARSDE